VAAALNVLTNMGVVNSPDYWANAYTKLAYLDKLIIKAANAMTVGVEVIRDAAERLAALGIMDTPSYWIAHYNDVKSLDGLILNMATRIKTNAGGKGITSVAAALNVLTDMGVVNSPDYWATANTKLEYLDKLIIKAANAMTAG
ncbi:MAG: hypothetical protein RR350_08595, partial [Oscillibacter sp.]